MELLYDNSPFKVLNFAVAGSLKEPSPSPTAVAPPDAVGAIITIG